ncbi:MAG: outer membrane beta-barrel protein [Acidobacteriota bacterium]
MNRSAQWSLGLSLLLAVLAAPTALAQSFEITPFAGYRFGGEFDRFDNDFFGIGRDVEVDEGASYGVMVDFAVNPAVAVELLASRQQTELRLEGGIFEPDARLFDLDVDYYHVGGRYQWTPGQVQPFVVVSAGVTQLSPDNGGSDETYFSASFGGGAKIAFSDHVGLRFEGRLFTTVVDEEDEVFCDRRFCYEYDDGEYLYQGEGIVGLVFTF